MPNVKAGDIAEIISGNNAGRRVVVDGPANMNTAIMGELCWACVALQPASLTYIDTGKIDYVSAGKRGACEDRRLRRIAPESDADDTTTDLIQPIPAEVV